MSIIKYILIHYATWQSTIRPIAFRPIFTDSLALLFNFNEELKHSLYLSIQYYFLNSDLQKCIYVDYTNMVST